MVLTKILYIKHIKLFLKKKTPIAVKKWIKYKLDPEYRKLIKTKKELEKIRKIQRGKSFQTNINGEILIANDSSSFTYMYKEIIIEKIYEFIPKKPNPFIIDGGANIGLASIFFGKNYPNARIIAFEADPLIAEMCKSNLESSNVKNVHLVNKALWDKETVLPFQSDGADAGRISSSKNATQHVETIVLSHFLSEQVDFLKLDIEGAEVKVLEEIQSKLHLVNCMFLEYHSFTNQEQKLDKILEILKKAGFRYILNTPSIRNKTPLKTKINFKGMDFYINIFATKE